MVRAAFAPRTMDRRTVDRTSTDVLDAEILVENGIGPVCASPVDPDQALEHELSSAFADREYFFCSLGCKGEFERKPTAYAVAGRSEP
ncbi:MAG TPA: hypothetical protein VIN63_13160 [Candidatus Limnocylindria bacterium]|nr:hypothetical protein [Chloroflexota bacterium]